MKKYFLTFFIIILSALFLFGCEEEPKTPTDENAKGLTPTLTEQILAAYGEEEAYIHKYYGKIGDAHIVAPWGLREMGEENTALGASGYMIYSDLPIPALVFKDGKLLSLREAHLCDLISKKDVYAIGKAIDPSFEERYPDPDTLYTQASTVLEDVHPTEIINLIGEERLNELSTFLDDEGFTAALSQGTLMEIMESYEYEGSPITDIVAGAHYDSAQGGGFTANGELFGFSNDYNENDSSRVTHQNHFYTKTALTGLELPYGIEFGDSLTSVFKKMGLGIDPYDDFASDEYSPNFMTLYRDDERRIEFYIMRNVASSTYVIRVSEQLSPYATRTTRFDFSSGTDVFDSFTVDVTDSYIKRRVSFSDTLAFPDDFIVPHSYREGGQVTLKLYAVTEQYYDVFLNGEEIPMSGSDGAYCYFTFTVPATDILVEIETVPVTIPEGKS